MAKIACEGRRRKRRRLGPWVGKIPLEEEMAIHSSIPAWEIPWTEEHFFFFFSCEKSGRISLNNSQVICTSYYCLSFIPYFDALLVFSHI